MSLFRWKSVLRIMFVMSSSYAIPSTCPSLISRCPGPKNSTQTEAFLDRESRQTKSTLRPFPSIPSLWERHLRCGMDDVSPVSLKAVKVLMRAKPWGYFGLSTYSSMWAVQLLSMSSVSIDSAAGLSAKLCVDAIVVLCGTVEFGQCRLQWCSSVEGAWNMTAEG